MNQLDFPIVCDILMSMTVAPAKTKQRTKAAEVTSSATVSKDNPYYKARQRVLSDLPEWRRKEVLEMEKIGNVDNRYYEDFVRQVIALAEDS